jgi:hypothetical protein
MANHNFGGHGLHMRNLAKPEYHLMQAMKQRYNLDSAAEVFEVTLRVAYEVMQTTDINGINIGDAWITQVIGAIRTIPERERSYSGVVSTTKV